jgi:GNAT superfamily N-acetyltransferase
MDVTHVGRVRVKQFEDGDLARLLSSGGPRDRAHHEERSRMHQRGEATYLVAWTGPMPCGRGTVLHRSKYKVIRDAMGDFPEMNALEATPQGAGIGSRLIASAVERAKAMGACRIGLAVEHENTRARRLYERLGYVEWKGGEVIDRWLERDSRGNVVREHADPCSYLVKHLT